MKNNIAELKNIINSYQPINEQNEQIRIDKSDKKV